MKTVYDYMADSGRVLEARSGPHEPTPFPGVRVVAVANNGDRIDVALDMDQVQTLYQALAEVMRDAARG